MKIKIFATLIMLLVISATIPLAAAQTCGTPDPLVSNSLETVEVEKKIKSGNEWVDQIEASIGDILRFRIRATYHDTDGTGPGFKLKNINITDRLPLGLTYVGGATQQEDEISDDGRNITWCLTAILYDGNSTSIEFNVKAMSAGELINIANVSAIESCYGAQRWGEASATVHVEEQEDKTPPSVEITKPKKKWLYIDDKEKRRILFGTRIIGPITIEVNASDASGIKQVEFYIDGKLKNIDITAPYSWKWDANVSLGRHKIKVIVYDNAGNNNSAERSILKIPAFEFIRTHKLALFLAAVVPLGTLLLLSTLFGGEKGTTEPIENKAPNVDAGGPYTGVVGVPVRFDESKVIDSNNDTLTYEWNFGDGSTGTEEKPLHTYEIDGTFTVALTVTDSQGASNTDTTKVTITKAPTEQDGNEQAGEEGDLFWYIVGGLTAALFASLVILLTRRKFYV